MPQRSEAILLSVLRVFSFSPFVVICQVSFHIFFFIIISRFLCFTLKRNCNAKCNGRKILHFSFTLCDALAAGTLFDIGVRFVSIAVAKSPNLIRERCFFGEALIPLIKAEKMI